MDKKTANAIAFNNEAKHLIKRLKVWLPEENGVDLCMKALAILKRLNKTTPIEVFMQQLAIPYFDQIRSKDFDFFMSSKFMPSGLEDLAIPMKRAAHKLNQEQRDESWESLNAMVDIVITHMALVETQRIERQTSDRSPTAMLLSNLLRSVSGRE